MAGLFGFGGSSKNVKGVKKEERSKKRFFEFFDIYKRKFSSLVKLNLLTILFCIPVITIGPAIAAMTKITRYYVEEKPVFLFSDFFDAFKSNFKQSFFMGLLSAIMFISAGFSFIYYYVQARTTNWTFFILDALIVLIAILFLTMTYYTFLLIVTLELKFSQILKNALFLALIGSKTNFFTTIFVVLIMLVCLSYFPFTMLLFIVIGLSTMSLIANFNSFQYVYKYLIKPYYHTTGQENPYEKNDEDAIFEDAT